ncbi:hypothetical protein [Sulfurovum sp.]|nr:hypothetical protein [Sulfurovum sp.]
MEYLSEIVWYAGWPVLIYVSLKFVEFNLDHFRKTKKVEEFEALHRGKK